VREYSSDKRSGEIQKYSQANVQNGGSRQKVTCRVTRLGDFSPIGQLLTLITLSKITEVAQTFGLTFTTVKFMY
jgi:hypothetical protein